MLTQQIAIVSGTTNVNFSQLAQVAAAVQKQVNNDVAPIWQVNAIITCFPSLEDVPLGYYLIYITDQVNGAEGYHQDENGQPYSLVKFDFGWTITVSHECIEMLVDPFGNRLVATASPVDNQGKVNILVEVCDPSEGISYTVNGIPVSDFYTPNYFDDHITPNVKYSHLGVITQPKEVLPGGYLSWYEPVTNKLWQQFNIDGVLSLRSLDTNKPAAQSLRAFIDSQTRGTITFTDFETQKPVTFVNGQKESGKPSNSLLMPVSFTEAIIPDVNDFSEKYLKEKEVSKILSARFKALL